MFAFDAASGAVSWLYDTAVDGRGAQFHGEMLIADDLLLIAADGLPSAHLYAFEAATGAVRWKQPFAGGMAVDLLRRGDAVLGVSMAGQVLALELATGRPLWEVDDPPPGARGLRPLDALLVGGRLLVPWRTGVVDAYDTTTGRRIWRRDLGKALTTSPLAIGDVVWIGGEGGRLLSFSAADGAPGVSTASLGSLVGDLVAAPGCLVALRAEGSGAGGGLGGPFAVACHDPQTGAERWSYRSPDEWGTFRPLVTPELIVVGRQDELLALDAGEGEVVWRLPVAGLPRGLGRSAGVLFVGTLSGAVTAHPWPASPPPEGS